MDRSACLERWRSISAAGRPIIGVKLVELNAHINDESFARAAADLLLELLAASQLR
jgi:hypothetical protein